MSNNQKKTDRSSLSGSKPQQSGSKQSRLTLKSNIKDLQITKKAVSGKLQKQQELNQRDLMIQEAYYLSKINRCHEDNDISYKMTDGEEVSYITPTQKIPQPNEDHKKKKFLVHMVSYNCQKDRIN